MRVLITGAAGFIGKHLAVRLQEQGYFVRAMIRPGCRPPELWRYTKIQTVYGDVRDPHSVEYALREMDTVCHLASILGPSGVSRNQFWAVNVEGTRAVMDAAGACGVSYFLHCSSCGVYGSVKPGGADETTPLAPEDPYEESKAAAEDVAREFGARGLPVCIVRPAWVYGPGDRRTCKLFRAIARHRLVRVGAAQNTQHPVYIDDLVAGFSACLERAAETVGQSYILAGAEIVTIDRLCCMIAEALGVRLLPFRLPLRTALWTGRLAERLFKVAGLEAPINQRKVDFFVKNRAYRIDAARNQLGFKPQVQLAQGTVEAVAYYRKAGWL